jgi:hypothetical protein
MKPNIAGAVVALSILTPLMVWAADLPRRPGARVLANTDWCTSAPLPPLGTPGLNDLGEAEGQIGPRGRAGWTFDGNNPPSRVWCMARDDHGRQSQCVGIAHGECGSMSWLQRNINTYYYPRILFFVDNEHSRDSRWMHLYSQ